MGALEEQCGKIRDTGVIFTSMMTSYPTIGISRTLMVKGFGNLGLLLVLLPFTNLQTVIGIGGYLYLA